MDKRPERILREGRLFHQNPQTRPVRAINCTPSGRSHYGADLKNQRNPTRLLWDYDVESATRSFLILLLDGVELFVFIAAATATSC